MTPKPAAHKEVEPCIHGDLGDCLDCSPRAAPTPMPWYESGLPGTIRHGKDFIENEICRCSEPNQLANAAFIVRAVNSHEKLLSAVKGLLGYASAHGLSDRLFLEYQNGIIAKAEGQ